MKELSKFGMRRPTGFSKGAANITLIGIFFLISMFSLSINKSYSSNLQNVDIAGSNNTVVQIIIELSNGDPDWLRNNQERISKLSARLGTSNALIVRFLAKVQNGEVPRDKWQMALGKVAADYQRFQQQSDLLAANDPIALDLVQKAQIAAEQSDFDAAEVFLIEAERLEEIAENKISDAQQKRRMNRVDYLALRAGNSSLKLDYVEAATLFEKAAFLASDVNKKKQVAMLREAASSYFDDGLIRGNVSSIILSIKIMKSELLVINPRNENPAIWASIQHRLGYAYSVLGEQVGQVKNLEKSAIHYNQALLERTAEKTPLEWADTQLNLGNLYTFMAAQNPLKGTRRQAIKSYNSALNVYSIERQPIRWALATSNMATTMADQAFDEGNTKLLESTFELFQSSIKIQDSEDFISDWANTSINFGHAMVQLGRLKSELKLLEDAVSLYQSLILKLDIKKFPFVWAIAHFKLGDALYSISELDSDRTQLNDIIAAYETALLVLSKSKTPNYWALTQHAIGSSYSLFGRIYSNKEHLHRALKAFEASQSVWTWNESPRNWAAAEANIGNVYIGIAENSPDEIDLISDAIIHLRSAAAILTVEQVPLEWATISSDIGRALWLIGSRTNSSQQMVQAKSQMILARDVFNTNGRLQFDQYIMDFVMRIDKELEK